MKRTSCVRHITAETIMDSAVFQCGDTGLIRADVHLLLASRPAAPLPHREDFMENPAWTRSAPRIMADESVALNVRNGASVIAVNRARVLNLAESSVFQVGSNVRIELEAFMRKVRLTPQPDKQ